MKSVHDIHAMLDEDHEIYYVHERHKVGECTWCDSRRADHVLKEFLWRLKNCGRIFTNLSMWSLGSSMKDTPYNRKVLRQDWHRFQARMNHIEGWVPLFRVVEVGNRGFLHVHVINGGYVPHDTVMRHWRALRGEKCNVNVKGQKGAQNVERLASYLIKYLTKESTKYRWLGPFYGLGKRRDKTVSNVGKNRRRYGGITCYTFTTINRDLPDAQRLIISDDEG